VFDLSVCKFGDVVETGDGMKGRFVGVARNKEYFKVWMDDCSSDGEEGSSEILHFTKEGRCFESGSIGRIVKVEKVEGKGEEEYMGKLNELSTENIVLGKMMDDFMEVAKVSVVSPKTICRGIGCKGIVSCICNLCERDEVECWKDKLVEKHRIEIRGDIGI
jgi:hypothetical protein